MRSPPRPLRARAGWSGRRREPAAGTQAPPPRAAAPPPAPAASSPIRFPVRIAAPLRPPPKCRAEPQPIPGLDRRAADRPRAPCLRGPGCGARSPGFRAAGRGDAHAR
ncbi:Hypothetical predicted protein [Marmota monax]|uniref:Uncharacterized protein n=1 Tax=Marmota monax TaxID=9995 RepID=A0A5E4CZY6_MARMO|nr:hypothetical protein GHT09_001298 [Marmota monax]VTJ87405.1 Hypothetical predicted protein [Marmota monax]